MSNAQLETAIEAAWEARDSITPATTGEAREAIEHTLDALDSGSLRLQNIFSFLHWLACYTKQTNLVYIVGLSSDCTITMKGSKLSSL